MADEADREADEGAAKGSKVTFAPTTAQKEALENLWKKIRDFFSGTRPTTSLASRSKT